VAIDSDVCARVRTLLSTYLGGRPLPADLVAEPVAMRCGTAVVYVRLLDADPTVVRVFSPLLRRVESSPGLLTELNELNGRLSFLRLFWRDGSVYAATELLAATLDDSELANACDVLADTADHYDVRLHARFGGELAYGPE
jgi:Putative bacterial sensory transduction regulator